MPIYKTSSDVNLLILGNPFIEFQNITNKQQTNKIPQNSQCSEHPFMKKFCMQKNLNIKFKLDGKVG